MYADPVERILAKVIKDDSGCWNCQLSGNTRGYAQVSVSGTLRYAHRVMYEEMVGPIPDGLHIDHLCANRRCCNPDHLEPVTPAENNRRANAKSPLGHVRTRTHCPKGHPYTGRNVTTTGRKVCRDCQYERRRKVA